MANAQTLRSLVSGSGTVSTTAGSKALAFSSAQSFKEGATVVVDPSGTPQLFTIDVGSGTSWTAMQSAASTVSGKSFDTSDPSTSRARGAGKIIPGARHTLYFSHLDDAASADAYYIRRHALARERRSSLHARPGRRDVHGVEGRRHPHADPEPVRPREGPGGDRPRRERDDLREPGPAP